MVKLQFSDSNISIESQLNRLALEFEVVDNLISTFKTLIPSITDSIKDKFDSLTSDATDNTKIIEKLHRDLTEVIKYKSYADYSKVLVSVPEGFKGNFLDYFIFLNQISPEVIKTANEFLAQYTFILSSFITNKEDKISLKDNTVLYRKFNTSRKEFLEHLNAFFSTKASDASKSKQYLSTVLHRFQDLDRLKIESNKLNKVYKDINLKEVQAGVRQAVEYLDIIIKNVEQDGITKVSGQAAKNIADGAYELGLYVEFLSVMVFRIEQLMTSYQRLIELLAKKV